MNYVNCEHAESIDVKRGCVTCKLGLFRGKPSFGVCNLACDRRTGPAVVLPKISHERPAMLAGGSIGGKLLCE